MASREDGNPLSKKKHVTPGELDTLFARGVVFEQDYQEFWKTWWGSNENERSDIITDLLAEVVEEQSDTAFDKKGITLHVTKNKDAAEKQAAIIGGYVVRRNAKGQFSKRGRHYQAVKRRKK